MARMDVSDRTFSRTRRGQRWSLVVGVLLVLGSCIVIRYFSDTGSASAQTDRQSARSRSAKTEPARRGPIATAPRPASATASRPDASNLQSTASQLKVVAVVNQEQITRDELARECLRRHGEDVLESEINKGLIAQACQKQGITITPQDVDAEIVRLAGKFGLPADRWLQMLQDERDIAPDQYRRDIVWPTLALRRLAAKELTVTKEELNEAIESEYGPKVQVRMISAAMRAKAEELRAQAIADPDQFGRLAKDQSRDENSAAARGLIPPIRKHVGDPLIEQTVFALKEGEISPVVSVAGQHLIFKCEKHIPATQIADHERKVVEEHLQDQIRDRKLRTAASELFKELQKDVKVVNVYNDAELRKTMPGVAATVDGRTITISQLAQQCLQRHGHEVLDGEINRLLLQQALKRRGLAVTKPEINQEIDRAAEAYGFINKDGSIDKDGWLKRVTSEDGVTVDLYVRDSVWPTVALKKLVENRVEITEDDIRKGFDANYGERVRVLAIVLGNQRSAQEVWRMARDNPTDKFFGELANQYSIEPISRANSGEVPPIRRYGGQPQVEEEAFKLKPGGLEALSGIIATGDKYIILRCLGRTVPVQVDMESVRDELVKDIREKKLRIVMAQEFDHLKDTAQIDNFLAGTSQSGKPSKVVPAGHQEPAAAARRNAPPVARPAAAAAKPRNASRAVRR